MGQAHSQTSQHTGTSPITPTACRMPQEDQPHKPTEGGGGALHRTSRPFTAAGKKKPSLLREEQTRDSLAFVKMPALHMALHQLHQSTRRRPTSTTTSSPTRHEINALKAEKLSRPPPRPPSLHRALRTQPAPPSRAAAPT